VATDDRQVLVAGSAAAPARYIIPGNGQIRPKVIFAKYDGTATTSVYVPALKITSDAGLTVGIFPAFETVAAGASANISWFPGVEPDIDTAGTGGGAGTIQNIVSPAATISVAAPSGPTTSLDLPTTGVAAGTYGDASHSAEITIDAEGRITTAVNVGIGGGSNSIGFEIGYDQITSSVNVTGTTEGTATTIIAGSSYTYDGAPVLATFFTPFIQDPGGAGNQQITVSLWEGATEITRLGIYFTAISAPQIAAGVTFVYRFTPSAAAHTYSVLAHVNTVTGTPLIGAGAGGVAAYSPAFLRFTKV
jgi:hypothetical protein